MKIAIVLSGCGVFDGSEIHEAVMTMYSVKKQGADYDIFAPDIKQHHVVNHYTGKETDETRNVLVESARIARGKISPLSELDMQIYDGIMFPGGFGAAKNLSNFAFKGADSKVNNEVERVIKEAVKYGKPIGALCISPVLLANVLEGAEITIGDDKATAQKVESMGAKHKNTNHGEVVVDKKYKTATTPCYMLDATIADIAEGAYNVTKAVLDMAK